MNVKLFKDIANLKLKLHVPASGADESLSIELVTMSRNAKSLPMTIYI